MPASGSPNATVYDVDFNVEQVALADHSCTAQPVQLWSTSAGISNSTTWPGPAGSQLATGSSNAGGTASGGSCGPGNLDINSSSSGNSGLLSNLQDVANHTTTPVNFLLRASSESGQSGDLQYRVISDSPTLDVYFNYAPNTPTNLGVDDTTTCTSTVYTSDDTPTVSGVKATDNNPSPYTLNLDYSYTVVDHSGASYPSEWLNGQGGTSTPPGQPGYKSGSAAPVAGTGASPRRRPAHRASEERPDRRRNPARDVRHGHLRLHGGLHAPRRADGHQLRLPAAERLRPVGPGGGRGRDLHGEHERLRRRGVLLQLRRRRARGRAHGAPQEPRRVLTRIRAASAPR